MYFLFQKSLDKTGNIHYNKTIKTNNQYLTKDKPPLKKQITDPGGHSDVLRNQPPKDLFHSQATFLTTVLEDKPMY